MTEKVAQLEYFYDPLCGWCYASAPALAGISQAYQAQLLMRPSGLFANGGTMRISAIADHAWRNDRRIAALTGQMVSAEYHDRILHNPDGLFDSTYATRAIVALGETDALLEVELLRALQTARYADARDTARAEVVAAVATEVARLHGHSIHESSFAERLRSDEVLAAVTADKLQQTTSRMQVLPDSSVPQLLVSIGEHREVVQGANLYGGAETALKTINKIVARATATSLSPLGELV